MESNITNPSIKEIFNKINDEVIAISWKWQILLSLFDSQEKVDLLNETAPAFFRACQNTFTDDVLLSINRVIDLPRTSGQDNLVITQLLDGIDKNHDPEFYEKINTRINNIIAARSRFKIHRDKRLAHNDFAYKFQQHDTVLSNITIAQLNTLIESLQTMLNEFDRFYFDSETSYEIIAEGGVETLLMYLQKGVDAFKEEQERELNNL